MTRLADHLMARLAASGVTTIFGVHGANSEDLFDAAALEHRLRVVVAKHEFGAGAMADGLVRITDTPAVVVTTSGGGAMNVVAALAESYDSRVPVLALVGTAPRPGVGRGAFQDMASFPDTPDIARVLSGVVGAVRVVDDPTRIDDAYDEVSAVLRSGLPAALVLPKDVQAAMLPTESPSGDTPPPATPHARLRHSEIDSLADDLARAVTDGARICVWTGEEASRARPLAELAGLLTVLDAAHVVSPGGRDLATDRTAGVTGVMGHPSAHRAVEEAEVCLAIGCRLSATDRAGLDAALRDTVITHVGRYAPRLPGVDRTIGVDDLRTALDTLVRAVRERIPPAPVRSGAISSHTTTSDGTSSDTTPSHVTRYPLEYLPTPATGPGPSMRTVVEHIGAVLPSGTTVFADAGNTGASAVHHLPFGDGRFVVALGMGGMGYAIAAGIGAAIGTDTRERSTDPAARERDRRLPRTVIIAGDGAFLMHGFEIHTAVEYGAPVTLVVLNNNAHGMCLVRENLYFPGTPTVNRFGEADIAAGLDAMFATMSVRRAGDAAAVRAAAAELFAEPGPNCLVVDTPAHEIPPFAPFL
ncbi:thiamine pyrophosphate-binding protein [Gordonia desulfuricans]|uniref:acetolactate synthase n=2 Tax=Gordonia desulfuricans TaxID=89051 RepID=A0A7K3LQN4_9ACTN|nr:thiamine pyrophosphate-binding protein [Gordonia desulfuricans]